MLGKIKEKLSGWKGKFMTLGGKLILIQSVLQAIPVYLLALIKPPEAITKAISKFMSDFFCMKQLANINITRLNGPHFAIHKRKVELA